MSKETGIPWCDSTFSPWWGCQEVSDECTNCYAREFDARFGGEHWGKDGPRRIFGDKHWNEPRAWSRAVERGRVGKDGKRWLVFCSSMADVFETHDALDAQRERLWQLIRETPRLTWLLLTKRPQNIGRMLPADLNGADHVWLGTTCGVQSSDWRIDALVNNSKAPVNFISVEPLLEEINIDLTGIRWCIVGSESGDGARPMDTNWARRILRQAQDERVATFMKQADLSAEGISTYPGDVGDPVPFSAPNEPYKRRDLRKGPDGIRRTHWIVERPYIEIDGVKRQFVEWPA